MGTDGATEAHSFNGLKTLPTLNQFLARFICLLQLRNTASLLNEILRSPKLASLSHVAGRDERPAYFGLVGVLIG